MNFLLPMYCRLCGTRLLTEENNFFCPTCWETTPRIERPFCTSCGKPHQRMVGMGRLSNFPCASCRAHSPRPVRRIWGVVHYDGAVAMGIRLFKFYGKTNVCKPLTQLMIDFALEEINTERYDYIVPVPLYKTRLRERGFNQSELLAKGLLGVFPGASLNQSLKRIRPTRAQSLLKHDERAENVRGAFSVEGATFEGKRVLLIDDVITTGDTVMECARMLHRSGAEEVDAFAVALAFHDSRF